MNLRDDERGQPVVIGALLIFTILILAFSGYQAFVVPNENRQVEYNHNQEVRNQILDLRSNVMQAGGTATTQSTTVALGTNYPSRALLLNPAPPSGTLETTAERSIVIRNAEASGETGDYWDGATDRSFTTRPIAYRPNYNVYQDAPRSAVEHGVFYDEYEDGTVLVKGDQPLVSGRSLSFVLVDGEYSRSGSGTVAVDVDPVSTSPNRVAVTDGAGAIEIELRTDIPETVWVGDLLNDQIDGASDTDDTCTAEFSPNDRDADRYIDGCEYDTGTDPNTLTLFLEADATYNLRMAKVGVGPQVTQPSTTYITNVEGDGSTIPDGGEQRIVAEIRDEFDNPVSGVAACADISSGSALSTIEEAPPTDISDADGRVTFTFQAADGVSGDAEVTVGYSCTGSDRPQTNTDTEFATFDIAVYHTGSGNGGGGSGGGGGASPSFSSDPSVTDSSSGGSADYSVQYSVDDPDGNFDRVRIEFVCTSCNGGGADKTKESTSLTDTITYSQNGRGGETYQITAEVIDNSGTTTDSYSVSDEADGTDP